MNKEELLKHLKSSKPSKLPKIPGIKGRLATHVVSPVLMKNIIEVLESENNDDDLQMCESCQKNFDIEAMKSDGECWFCPTCWMELAPIMRKEYEELVARGEIEEEEFADESEPQPPIGVEQEATKDLKIFAQAFVKENYEAGFERTAAYQCVLKFMDQWQSNNQKEGWSDRDMILFNEWLRKQSWELDFIEQRSHSQVEKLEFWKSNVANKPPQP